MFEHARTGAIVGMLAAGAVAALPTAAHAGARFDYRQVFTTPVPGASTGVDTTILYKHPDDPNAKPIPVRQEVFTFPAGTQFDDSIVPDCTVPDIQLQLQGESACPQESWIGSGHGNTSMTGFPGAGENAITANAFDYGSGEFRVLGASADLPIRAVAHGRREGRITTVQIPSTPGGPPDGEGALRRVHNVFPARSLGRRAYVRTPKTCPRSGTWLFKASLTFADGAVDNASYRMPCRRR